MNKNHILRMASQTIVVMLIFSMPVMTTPISGIFVSAHSDPGTAHSANDPQAQVISGLSVSNVTPTGATISWQTDEPADSALEYGPTTSYGTYRFISSTPATSHTASITGLNLNATYHIRVI